VPDIWYYADADKQVGPLTLQELRQELAAFPNANDVLVWCNRFADWKPASNVIELSAVPPPLPPIDVKAKRRPYPVVVRGILFLGIVAGLVVAGAISNFFGEKTDEPDRAITAVVPAPLPPIAPGSQGQQIDLVLVAKTEGAAVWPAGHTPSKKRQARRGSLFSAATRC
jgi:hypothetical protein